MIVFPRETLARRLASQDSILRRRPLLVSAPLLFIALVVLLLGTLPGVAREAVLSRSLQTSGSNGDVPALAKREPLRALAALERKDGQGSQWLSADGVLVPTQHAAAVPVGPYSCSDSLGSAFGHASFWPAPLARAPPLAA